MKVKYSAVQFLSRGRLLVMKTICSAELLFTLPVFLAQQVHYVNLSVLVGEILKVALKCRMCSLCAPGDLNSMATDLQTLLFPEN